MADEIRQGQQNGGQSKADQKSLTRQHGQQNGGQQDDGPQSEADRQKSLLTWGDKVLDQIGVRQAIADATTIEELQRITFDPDSTAVVLAINDALHPPNKAKRQRHFDGLSAAALRKILKNRFTDLKRIGKSNCWAAAAIHQTQR